MPVKLSSDTNFGRQNMRNNHDQKLYGVIYMSSSYNEQTLQYQSPTNFGKSANMNLNL